MKLTSDQLPDDPILLRQMLAAMMEQVEQKDTSDYDVLPQKKPYLRLEVILAGYCREKSPKFGRCSCLSY